MSVNDLPNPGAEKTPGDHPQTTNKHRKNAPVSSHDGAAKEYGGPKGKEPTRYGDWEKNGRCIDF